jgi:hypothetical protein
MFSRASHQAGFSITASGHESGTGQKRLTPLSAACVRSTSSRVQVNNPTMGRIWVNAVAAPNYLRAAFSPLDTTIDLG